MLVGVVVKVSVGVAVGVLVSVATTGLAFHEDEVMFLGGVVTWMLVGVLAWLNFEFCRGEYLDSVFAVGVV
jgi:hypothetical protein